MAVEATPTAAAPPAAKAPQAARAATAVSAFDALAGTRPRVRRDVLFTETPGGVLFHNADGGFHLTGRTAYRFASLMVPHLAGHHRLGDICQGFGPAQQAMAAELVKTLYERGFARDIPDDETTAGTATDTTTDATRTPVPNGSPDPLPAALPDAVTTRFAAQIAYADHYADGSLARFRRYRTTRVAILGAGPVARWCALSLVRNGGGHLAVEGDAHTDPTLLAEIAELATQDCPVTLDRLPTATSGWTALDGYDIVVVTGADAAARTHALLSAGVPDGKTLIPAWTFGRRSVTGPLSKAGSTGCWSCAVLRLGGNTDAGTAADIWSEVAGGATARAAGHSPLTGPVAAMSGNLLGYEIFRLTTGVLPAETDGQVLVQDLESLDVMAEPVQPHPRCALCAPATKSPRPALPGGLTLPITPTVESAGEAEALVEGLNRISTALVRPFTGIFSRYDDESLTQTPSRSAESNWPSATVPAGASPPSTCTTWRAPGCARCTRRPRPTSSTSCPSSRTPGAGGRRRRRPGPRPPDHGQRHRRGRRDGRRLGHRALADHQGAGARTGRRRKAVRPVQHRPSAPGDHRRRGRGPRPAGGGGPRSALGARARRAAAGGTRRGARRARHLPGGR